MRDPGLAPAVLADDPSAPWVRRVEWAEAALIGVPRVSPAVLRGAVCAELERALSGGKLEWKHLHVDWHNHTESEQRNAAPRVLYRTECGPPRLYLWGERVTEHVELLMRHLHALRLPRGDVVEVEEVRLRRGAGDVRVRKQHWMRYEVVTPLYPPRVSYARRPRRDWVARRAWASQLLVSSMVALAHELDGLDLRHGGTKPFAYVERMDEEPVRWRQQTAIGWRGRFVSNVVLPEGIALGSRRAEGFGEVRTCR